MCSNLWNLCGKHNTALNEIQILMQIIKFMLIILFQKNF